MLYAQTFAIELHTLTTRAIKVQARVAWPPWGIVPLLSTVGGDRLLLLFHHMTEFLWCYRKRVAQSKPLPGLRDGSFDKNPKINNPTKKVTTV